MQGNLGLGRKGRRANAVPNPLDSRFRGNDGESSGVESGVESGESGGGESGESSGGERHSFLSTLSSLPENRNFAIFYGWTSKTPSFLVKYRKSAKIGAF